MLILLLLLPVSNAQFVNAKVVNIKAVAVKTGEKPEGATIDITVTITPGSGKVFVSTTPYTEIDMQGSAQLAALTACDLLGMDFMKYNFFYEIRAEAPIVGGPSAGAVMTIATIAALKNLSIRKDVFMTGMIYPDGFIGPVGGIPYKLEAAAKSGAKIFLIPKGQRIVYVQERVEQKKGPFIIVTTKTKPIDLVEYGKKFGVDVVEVSTIEEALWYYTGYTIEKPKPTFNISKYSDLLKILAVNMKNSTMDLLAKVEKITRPDEIKEIIKEGDRYFEEGYYYTATSKYFQAKIELRYLYYRVTITDSDELSKEFDKVEKEIDDMVNYLKGLKDVGVESFQIIGAAEERIALAERYLFDAETSGDFDKALYNLAWAKERIESARIWLSLLNTIKEDVPINKEELKKRAEFYFREAESIIVYASSIGGYQNLITSAEDSMDLARKQFDMGFYAGAAITCIDAITRASLSVEFIGVKNNEMLNAKLESAKKAAESALAEAEKAVTPILPIAYYEFAETQKDTFVAISYYKLSGRLAKLILVVAKAYPERGLVQVEYPPVTPSENHYKQQKLHEISNVEIPGFCVLAGIIAIAVASYVRRRR
jgi:uncharacterized protein